MRSGEQTQERNSPIHQQAVATVSNDTRRIVCGFFVDGTIAWLILQPDPLTKTLDNISFGEKLAIHGNS